ncbi:archaea-specific SMC-related protein [Natrinema sp. J7-1]|uniref:archaea-specific SMC-related protein n=1 Tax=Natrinema sp. J7-1 TaxID=1172566 RepID=UPI0006775C38|nr:archaea-specific SMC-related protein [Natrinema sp. J7-1]
MTWQFSIENIAGIRQGEARIEPGVNVVRASNWQGKSSFLASIETALGTATPLTEGQATGQVTVTTADEEFAVTLERAEGSVSRTGTPYLHDEYDRVCATLFASLDETNEIRRAVRNGETIEHLLTRPLDFENIDERIADLKAERKRVETERDRAAEAADRLPQLRSRVTDLESTLDELHAQRADLDDETGGGTDSRDQLSELRAERDRVDSRIARLETTAKRVRETLSEKRTELESLSVPSGEDIERELETLHEERRDVERDVELLQSVYEANKRVLDEGRIELLTDVSHDVLADTVQCWLCGEDATRDGIEAQLAALDERIRELDSQADEYRERAATLEAKRDESRQARRRETELTDRIGALESRLAETEESLETARERRAELASRIETLAEAVDATEERVLELESEIKYTETEVADVRADLEDAEAQADQLSTLDDEYASLTAEISELRGRKAEIKRRTREAFSTALDDLLERFDTGFETARLTSGFDLVVARDGREARLDALSEGEREVLGLVAAVAGHEAFDVDERVPVLLLDGLGGLASDNLRTLVDYLRDRAAYLVLTAYPEHEGFDGHELSPADWQVVSHDSDAETAS